MNLSAFSSQGLELVGASNVQLRMTTMRRNLFIPFMETGWQVQAEVSGPQMVSDLQFRYANGVLMADPVFGNYQVQLELTIDWIDGCKLALVAYPLPSPSAPLSRDGLGARPAVHLTVAQMATGWATVSETQKSSLLVNWLFSAENGAVASFSEFRKQLDAAMVP